ncbi:FAD-dependent monooxygenase CTB5 [Paramyrothecium foliicola]|nr:FAD-dependent monooxygenase CTB5 [Paramyrothecium foliicola]
MKSNLLNLFLGITSFTCGATGFVALEQVNVIPGTSAECCHFLKQQSSIENIFAPGDRQYLQRVQSYWSLTAQLRPKCFVQPESSSEVSTVVKLIVEQTKCDFAIRSGGHSSSEGANNIEDGITIDLALLDEINYDEETTLLSVQPGAKWLSVYRTIDPLGRGVAGARLGDVGVGGFLLGGGFSFYLYREGVACNGIRGIEVVLANGTIIEANQKHNSDLFKVLKGGGSGFGIVTRFDLYTFNTNPILHSVREYPETASKQFYGALERWTDGIEYYPSGSAIIFWSYRFNLRTTQIISVLTDISGRSNAPVFEELKSIKGNISFSENFVNMSELALGVQAPGYRNIWWTMTLRNDRNIIAKAVELHNMLVTEMKAQSSDGDFETQCFFQPLPTAVGERGDNILGINRQRGNAIVLLASLAVNGVDQEKLGRRKMFKWKANLEKYAGPNGILDYRYMNYADGTQDVLSGYGQENVCRMWDVVRQFDPDGIFQYRQPGGHLNCVIRDYDQIIGNVGSYKKTLDNSAIDKFQTLA